MTNSMLIEEKYNRHWPVIATGSLLLSVVLFIIYLFSATPLQQGIFRLGAFALFATGILSLLKVRQGKLTVLTSLTDEGDLSVSYSHKGRETETELIPVATVVEVKVDEMPNRSLYNDLVKSDRSIRIRRVNSEEWDYLYKVDSRVIPFTEENAKKLYLFLKNQIRST